MHAVIPLLSRVPPCETGMRGTYSHQGNGELLVKFETMLVGGEYFVLGLVYVAGWQFRVAVIGTSWWHEFVHAARHAQAVWLSILQKCHL